MISLETEQGTKRFDVCGKSLSSCLGDSIGGIGLTANKLLM